VLRLEAARVSLFSCVSAVARLLQVFGSVFAADVASVLALCCLVDIAMFILEVVLFLFLFLPFPSKVSPPHQHGRPCIGHHALSHALPLLLLCLLSLLLSRLLLCLRLRLLKLKAQSSKLKLCSQ
jgi:hypothetical protein